MADTGANFPTITDSSSGVTTPDNAWTDNGQNADFPDGAANEAVYRGYGLNSELVNVTINGLEVVTKQANASAGQTGRLDVSLSWDGGSTYTATKAFTCTSDSYQTLTNGDATDLWGRASWATSEFTDTNFKVKVVMNAGVSTAQTSIDFITVKVYYTASSGGHFALVI